MSSSALALDYPRRRSKLKLRDFLRLEPPGVRRYDSFLECISQDLHNVRCWFVKTLDVWAREIAMTFLDAYDAEPIVELGLMIYRPELARARKRRKGIRADLAYHDICFVGG